MFRDGVFVCDLGLSKEKRHWHIQHLSDIKQSVRRNTVIAGFVFLDLLRVHADSFSELILGHLGHPATLTHILTDEGV